MKKIITILLLALICIPVNEMLGGSDKIYWTSDVQLTWKDFKKEVPKTSKSKTHGMVGIDIDNGQKDDNTLVVTVHAYFMKSGSSKPNEDGQTDEALHHEQYRFNLAEAYARKIKKQISDSTFKTAGKFYVVASKITKQASKDCSDAQHRYDEETKIGSIDTAQARWDKYIDGELQKYSGYDESSMDVTVEKKITKDIK